MLAAETHVIREFHPARATLPCLHSVVMPHAAKTEVCSIVENELLVLFKVGNQNHGFLKICYSKGNVRASQATFSQENSNLFILVLITLVPM